MFLPPYFFKTHTCSQSTKNKPTVFRGKFPAIGAQIIISITIALLF